MILKVLTLTQPWASLVIGGQKRIETRKWQAYYRGLLGIHAATGLADLSKADYLALCTREPFRSALQALGYTDANDLPRGMLLGTVRLTDCRPTPTGAALETWGEGRVLPPPEPERSFGDYRPGRYAWWLEQPRPLAIPVPCKGALGLWSWEVPAAVARVVAR